MKMCALVIFFGAAWALAAQQQQSHATEKPPVVIVTIGVHVVMDDPQQLLKGLHGFKNELEPSQIQVPDNERSRDMELTVLQFEGYRPADIIAWIQNNGWKPAVTVHLLALAKKSAEKSDGGNIYALGDMKGLGDQDQAACLVWNEKGGSFKVWPNYRDPKRIYKWGTVYGSDAHLKLCSIPDPEDHESTWPYRVLVYKNPK